MQRILWSSRSLYEISSGDFRHTNCLVDVVLPRQTSFWSQNKLFARAYFQNKFTFPRSVLLFKSKYTKLRMGSRGHKARGQGQGHKKNPRPKPRAAFPRTDTLEAKDRNARGQGPRTQAQVLSKKKVFTKIFQAISKKKKKGQRSLQKNVFQKIFQALHKILTIQKIVLSSEDRPIFGDLRPRGPGQGQGLDLRGHGQGLQNVFSRTSSRTPPLLNYCSIISIYTFLGSTVLHFIITHILSSEFTRRIGSVIFLHNSSNSKL